MGSDIVKIGDKVDIRILQQVEQGWKTGERPDTYRSKVQDVKENGDIEIEVPTQEGKSVSLPSGVRLEFLFYTRTGMFRCVAHIKRRYVRGRLYLFLIEQKTPLEKFQRREYYRFECVMEMSFYPVSKEEIDITPLNELKEHHRLTVPEDLPRKALAVDISGGGIRFVSDHPGQEGEYMVVSLTLPSEQSELKLDMLGQTMVCQSIEKKSGGKKNTQEKYEYRVQFIKGSKEREQIIKYIFEQERKSRQKG